MNMAERSAAALHWLVVTLVLWGLTRLLPPTGARRKAPEPNRTVVSSENLKDHVCLVARLVPPRSPYSRDRAPLDGASSPLSRPYLPTQMEWAPEVVTVRRTARVRRYWAARERAVRLRRRTALVMAADFGIDLDTRDIHAVLGGVGAR